ncbi:MAG: hypothetical protein AB8B97_01180 [Granulosicoccus sp.]
MFTHLEAVYQQINNLIDYMGYVLMLTLSVLLWWGIYSGVEITVSQSMILVDSSAVVHNDHVLVSTFESGRLSPPSVVANHDFYNAQSLASGL